MPNRQGGYNYYVGWDFATQEYITMSTTAPTANLPNFRYAYGRANSRDANFNVISRRVNLEKTQANRRWVLDTHVGQAFPAMLGGNYRPHKILGDYYMAYAQVVEHKVIHLRVSTTRRGHATHIGETAILLDSSGPEILLSANIPTVPEFPENEIMVFNGRGRILDTSMLLEMNLLPAAMGGNEEVYFWPGKLEEIGEDGELLWEDSGIFNYTERAQALRKAPTIRTVKNHKGEEVHAIVPASPTKKRRIKVRK